MWTHRLNITTKIQYNAFNQWREKTLKWEKYVELKETISKRGIHLKWQRGPRSASTANIVLRINTIRVMLQSENCLPVTDMTLLLP